MSVELAQKKREVEGEGARAHAGGLTLASKIADAAAAQLLIYDELPEEERPREEDRVLLVGIVWGGTTLVELEQVEKGDALSVSRLFDLPTSTLPKNFQLVRPADGGHVVTLPEDLHAEVHGNRRVLPLAVKGARVDAPFRGHTYTIGDGDRVVAQITPSLTLIARYVRAERAKDKPLWRGLDVLFASVLLLALVAMATFFVAMGRMPGRQPDLREALTQEHVARYQGKT